MDESASTYPGMSQVVADRVTSMRMELENQIPAERVQLIKNLESSQARVDELEASLKQQRLRSNTFETDIADRQANAQMSIETSNRRPRKVRCAIEGQISFTATFNP